MPIKNSDTLYNEALKVVKDHLDKAKAEREKVRERWKYEVEKQSSE